MVSGKADRTDGGGGGGGGGGGDCLEWREWCGEWRCRAGRTREWMQDE